MTAITDIPDKKTLKQVQEEYLIKGINTKNPNTTRELGTEDNKLSKIYTGGSYPILNRLENFKSTGLDVSNPNVFSASDPIGNIIIKLPNNISINLQDIVAKNTIPYDKSLKQRLINAVETDQVIFTCFNILTDYVFSQQRQSSIFPIGANITRSVDEFKTVLDGIIDKEIQKELMIFMDSADRYSRVWEDFAPLAFKHALTIGTGGFFVELLNSESIVNEDQEIFVPVGSPVVCKMLHPYYFEKVYFDRKKLKPIFLEYTDKNYKLIEDTDITRANKTIPTNDNNTDTSQSDYVQDFIPDSKNNIGDDKLPGKKKFDINYSYVEELKGYKQFILKDPDELKKEREYYKNVNQNILLPLNQCVLFKYGMPVSPNVDFFGVSKLFSVLEISEINREIHYDILPSLNKSQMSGNGIIIAPMIKSTDKLKELEGQLEEGANYIVTPSPIDYKKIDITIDMSALAGERFDNVRHILMGMNFPSPFVNFESETNRDTLRLIAEFFKNTNLQPLRNMVNNAMSNQWYLPLQTFFFKYILPQIGIVSKKNYSFLDLKIKIVNEFANINFSVYEDLLKILDPITFLTEAEKRDMIQKAPIPPNEAKAEKIDKTQQQINEIDNVIRKGMNKGGVLNNIDEGNEETEKETVEVKKQIQDIKNRK
jgi:hypothetical protein